MCGCHSQSNCKSQFIYVSLFVQNEFILGGIRLCDSLKFVTLAKSGNSAKIKHANFITDHTH